MAQLTQLIYVSSVRDLMSEQALTELLTSARVENKKHNITGMLLYKDGDIMQVVEGEARDIDQLFSNIVADTRHSGIIELIRESVAARDFSDWSMSYRNISDQAVEGFSDFMMFDSLAAGSSLVQGKAKRLLTGFRGNPLGDRVPKSSSQRVNH